MKLSEEINLGRMLLKPVPGNRNDGKGGGCAFGMAEAAGGDAQWKAWVNVEYDFVTLPCKCKSEWIVGSCNHLMLRGLNKAYSDAIVHVFNYHVCMIKDWTLDRLIEWIASIEPAEEEAPVHGEPVAEPTLEPAEIGAKSR